MINKQALRNQNTLRRWRQAVVLLVDEISMLSPKLLEVDFFDTLIFLISTNIPNCTYFFADIE